MDWQVRRAIDSDAQAVRDVAVEAWRATYSGLLSDSTIEAFLAGPYDLENVRRRINQDEFFVAIDGSEIVAYADAVPEAEAVFVAAIYALPDRRLQGAGTALLNAILERHPDLPIDAYVLLHNTKGEGFYERRGFLPAEAVEQDLFGERVTERRWRRDAPAT